MANGKSPVTIEDGEVLIKDGRLIAGSASLALSDISSMKVMAKHAGRLILLLIGMGIIFMSVPFIVGLHEFMEYDNYYIIAFSCAVVAVVFTARYKLIVKTASQDIWHIVGKRKFVAQVKAAIEKAKADSRSAGQRIDVAGGRIETL